MDRVRSSFACKSPCGLMKITQSLIVGVFFLATISYFLPPFPQNTKTHPCKISAIYNFGDSNSDTGSVSAAFGRVKSSNGQTFFGKPSGRYCDGRLIIDFIAEKLGLQYPSAYLDSIGANFRHGANFAASGSTIQPADAKMLKCSFNAITLGVQLLQFQQFKERTIEFYKQAKNSFILPRSDDFSKALYTIDTGQNDLHAGITTMTEEQVLTYIPYLIDEFASAIKKLNELGARIFWIHNTGPIGCLPFFVNTYPPKSENADQIGCVKSYNDLAQEFNKQLKEKVSQLRSQLENAFISYVDVYSVKYNLITEAKKYGMYNYIHDIYHVLLLT